MLWIVLKDYFTPKYYMFLFLFSVVSFMSLSTSIVQENAATTVLNVSWIAKLHPTFHQHEGEKVTTAFSFLGELIL